jgi:hypothetical protein
VSHHWPGGCFTESHVLWSLDPGSKYGSQKRDWKPGFTYRYRISPRTSNNLQTIFDWLMIKGGPHQQFDFIHHLDKAWRAWRAVQVWQVAWIVSCYLKDLQSPGEGPPSPFRCAFMSTSRRPSSVRRGKAKASSFVLRLYSRVERRIVDCLDFAVVSISRHVSIAQSCQATLSSILLLTVINFVT